MSLNGTNPERRFWTAKEAAHYLGVHVATLYGYCRYKPSKKNGHGRISVPPFRRIGVNVLRFPITEFVEWAGRFDSPEQEKK